MINRSERCFVKMLPIFLIAIIFGVLNRRAHGLPIYNPDGKNYNVQKLIFANPSLNAVQNNNEFAKAKLENALYLLMLRKIDSDNANLKSENIKKDNLQLYRASRSNGKPTFIRFGKRAAPSFIRFGKRSSMELLNRDAVDSLANALRPKSHFNGEKSGAVSTQV